MPFPHRQGSFYLLQDGFDESAQGGGHVMPCIDYPDVAGVQSSHQTGKTDIDIITEVMSRYEPGFHGLRRKILVNEGIVETAMKIQEILGYDDQNRPVRGLVVSPQRAPTAHRGLFGEVRQDDKGFIKKPNHPWEEVGDTQRYFAAREIDRAHILTMALTPGGPVVTDGKLTPEQRKTKVNEWLTENALNREIARQRAEAEQEPAGELVYDEG